MGRLRTGYRPKVRRVELDSELGPPFCGAGNGGTEQAGDEGVARSDGVGTGGTGACWVGPCGASCCGTGCCGTGCCGTGCCGTDCCGVPARQADSSAIRAARTDPAADTSAAEVE